MYIELWYNNYPSHMVSNIFYMNFFIIFDPLNKKKIWKKNWIKKNLN